MLDHASRDSDSPRRSFLKQAALLGAATFTLPKLLTASERRPNIALITVDDLNYDAISWLGGKTAGLTPNIDRLATQGMAFTQAYNTHSRCSPSRGSVMTGLYQDGYSDAPGTKSTVLRDGLLPLPAILKQKAGYRTAVLGKETHYNPRDRYEWDLVHPMADMGVGRHPDLYFDAADAFIKQAKADAVPFFLSANTHDPHRPFAGSDGEHASLRRRFKNETKKRTDDPTFVLPPQIDRYTPDDAAVPGFLPDLPEVRQEISWYMNSVYRCDQFVGRMLEAVDAHDSGGDTLVIFLSDNGMHFPFAKSNCYATSVRTPLIFRWTGKIEPGKSDSIVSTVDLLPTVLETVGVEPPHHINGTSLTDLFTDPAQEIRDVAFASINGKGKSLFEMRSLIGSRYIYIYNHFSDGKAQFYDGRYGGGESLRGMEKRAATDPSMRKRIDFMYYRTKEELYDVREDPNALNNLAMSKNEAPALNQMRSRMSEILASNKDPFAAAFDDYVTSLNR